jgi:DNA repair exonuclease SbcCD ATPase subunit
MDFDSIADELYAGDPADFTASRDARAREARSGGDRALAERVKKLRKPTAAADVVNRLPRAELEKLVELGKSLRKAHAELAGAELRELSRKRHELVQDLLRRAGKLTDAVAREVEATFEAVVGSPEAAEQVLGGRLSSALSPDAAAPWPESTVTPKPRPEKPAPVSVPEKPKQDKEQAKRERAEQERLKRERAELTRAAASAEAELAKAEKRAAKAAKATEGLREKLTQAEEAEAAEQASVDAATQALADAEQALEDFGS